MSSQSTKPAWKILVVDDAFDNVEVLRIGLKFSGAEVKTANDGLSALEILGSYTPDLILLDISMPHMNGWDTLKAIRMDARLDKVPVVAVTAYALKGDRERIMEAGFADYIAKPFHLADVLKQITGILTSLVAPKVTEPKTVETKPAETDTVETKPAETKTEEQP